ncbi:probable signal peptidase complex subunit 1 isoform X2 [Macadamia integrifolia]|nr:probable signal peptidase complex subunit 1 isoform X2 [Macadamia integrifolia]
MDWQGQKLSEQLMQIMLVVFAVVAFITGYIIGSFQMMFLMYAAGVVLTTLITVPNWPFFNRHPLKWLDPIEAERHPKPHPVTSKKKPTKQNQKTTAFKFRIWRDIRGIWDKHIKQLK